MLEKKKEIKEAAEEGSHVPPASPPVFNILIFVIVQQTLSEEGLETSKLFLVIYAAQTFVKND